MASWIDKFLGFTYKPRDGSVPGFALEERDQLYLFVNTVASVTLGLNVSVYNPETGKSRSFQALPGYAFTTTTYAQDTGDPPSLAGLFSSGEVLTSASVVATSGSLPATGQTFCAVFIYRKGVVMGQLIGDFIYVSHAPTWIGGQPVKFCGPMYQPDTVGKLYTFQGTATNGAGGAGTTSCTVTAATGGRVVFLLATINNNDSAGRVAQMVIDDGSNQIATLAYNGSLAATGQESLDDETAVSGVANAGNAAGKAWIAGSNRFVMSVAANAASKGAAYAWTALVYGGAPTITLAGASTPTLTTNTSRFESG